MKSMMIRHKSSWRERERELYMDEPSPEARVRAGDPVSFVEIVSKKKAAPPPEPKGTKGDVSQLIRDTVSQFLRPPTKDQATMIFGLAVQGSSWCSNWQSVSKSATEIDLLRMSRPPNGPHPPAGPPPRPDGYPNWYRVPFLLGNE